MRTPTFREFTFTVAATSSQPTVEAMQLLAQAMDSYADLTDSERRAVVDWFIGLYGASHPTT